MAWGGAAKAAVAGTTTGLLLLSIGVLVSVAHHDPPETTDLFPRHSDVNPTRYVDATTTYAQQDVDAAVASTLDGLDRDVFADLSVGSPPCTDGCDGLWLRATVRLLPSESVDVGGADLPSVWQADLAQGAIAERVAGDASDLHDVVTGSEMTLRFDDGTTQDLGGGAGNIQPGQLFAAQASNESDSAIVTEVKAVLDTYGLVPSSVRVVHPLGPAVFVQATVDRVSSLRGKWYAIQSAILGDPIRYEGLYLEIDAADGHALARGAASFRTGSGRVWFVPGMDEILGIPHGGAPK